MAAPSPTSASSPNMRIANGPTGTTSGSNGITITRRPSDRDELHLDLAHLGVEAFALDELEHFAQHLIGMPRIVADAHDAERGQLPRVLRVDLGHGDVESIADPLRDRFEHHALAFERAVFGQVKR